MNIDEQHPPHRPPQHTNALAGPSTMPETPSLYLPPPGPPKPRAYFTSTQDLLTRFQLLPSYDKYVRPFAPVVGSIPQATTSSATEKGKGKEKDIPSRDVAASSPAAHTPGAAHDGDDEEGGRGEKKFKNYRHLIKGIPGKHSMKKDDFMQELISVPPKQKAAILPFDETQQDAFSVSLEGLKGWNIHALVAESSQAREDRKRRKELKKMAKAQAQGIVQPTAGVLPGTPSALPTTPATAPISTPAGPTITAPPRTSTPRPGIPRPAPAHQQPPQSRGRTPVGIGTPHSISTPGPGAGGPPTATPVSQAPPTVDHAPPSRGLKREREYSIDGGLQVNGNIPPPAPAMKAKAGNANVRPRPVKKQRLDATGHAQVPIQQPTPHA